MGCLIFFFKIVTIYLRKNCNSVIFVMPSGATLKSEIMKNELEKDISVCLVLEDNYTVYIEHPNAVINFNICWDDFATFAENREDIEIGEGTVKFFHHGGRPEYCNLDSWFEDADYTKEAYIKSLPAYQCFLSLLKWQAEVEQANKKEFT